MSEATDMWTRAGHAAFDAYNAALVAVGGHDMRWEDLSPQSRSAWRAAAIAAEASTQASITERRAGR